MIFDCYYCNQRKTIVTFIRDGFVPGVVNVPRSRACCMDCKQAPTAIDGQPSPNNPTSTALDDGAPF